MIVLWINLGWIVFLVSFALVVALVLGKNKFKKSGKITVVVSALALLLLGGGSIIKSLIKPEIKTFTGVFVEEKRAPYGMGLASVEYCFETSNEKIYIELDAVSKAIIIDEDFVEGEIYTVSFEENSNLIVEVSKTG